MDNNLILKLADPQATLENTGGKGASLARLAQAGFSVPDGFHVTTLAYRQFIDANELQPLIMAALEKADINQPATLENASRQIEKFFLDAAIPGDISGAVARAYASLPGQDPAVAVRSSATAEDLPGLSFAGQQETFLNIQGIDAVLDAVRRCWASLWTARAIGYRLRNHIDHQTVSLAVVVQVLVPADAAGILFTANPLNGRRDQAVISAAWGLGEAVVGGLVTPDHLVVEKTTRIILERKTAMKQVMTVRIEGTTETRAVPEELRLAPVISDQEAGALAQIGLQIEELYGMPMDIEWAMLDGKIFILQARPVTTLKNADTLPAGEILWRGPKRGVRYLRNNIVELMPDPLTPLFNTLGRNAVNRAMKRVLDRFIGQPDLLPEEPIITINGYAYYNGDFNKGKMLSLVANSGGIMRRMFTGMEERWITARSSYEDIVAQWSSRPLAQIPSGEILKGAGELMDAAIDYYTAIVSGLIPAAWISEGLFTAVYNLLIKRKSDPAAAVYLLGFDSTPLEGEKALFDLAKWIRNAHPALANYLAETPTNRLVRQLEDNSEIVSSLGPAWLEWQHRFQAHLDRYGANIYDLDFAKPTPADQPGPLIETLKLFLTGKGVNPHERQQASIDRREQATGMIRSRLKGPRRSVFEKYLARAQHLAPLREEGLAGIGYGYPCLRQFLLEIGKRVVSAGAIEQAEDVFWLQEAELVNAAVALDQGGRVDSYRAAVQQRKAEWQALKRLTPPFALPHRMKIRKVSKTHPGGETLKGVACSPGRATGTARVLSGPDEFDQMRPGDVLVATITTPAWTPLFAMASAIVTDVGGPLSHGSIVAREYNIPAVLGTGGATRRIQSGDIVTVDGDAGKVYFTSPGSPVKDIWALDNPKDQFMRASICELMPNPLTPLFATMGIEAISRGITSMAKDLFNISLDSLTDFMQTVHGYAYQKVSFTRRQWWLMLSRMVPAFPRMLRQGVPYWRNIAHPQYKEVTKAWQAKLLPELPIQDLYTGIQEIMKAFGLHLGALMASTMGPSAGSEGLFTKVYEKLARQPGDPPAPAFLMGFDNLSLEGEKSLYDLAMWSRERPALAAYLVSTPPGRLAQEWKSMNIPENIPAEDWRTWCNRFTTHLNQYGYAIYDMDFASPLPMDLPDTILDTMVMFINGQGKDPYERQAGLVQQREQAVNTVRSRLRGPKRWAFEKALRWAQSQAPLRENGIAEIGLGYPVLREMLHELGRRFVEAGGILKQEDIFWLEQKEIEQGIQALSSGSTLTNFVEKVAERKALWQDRKRLVPPPQLPPKMKYMGFDTEKMLASRGEQDEDGVIRGTPCSPGCVKGIARVLHGPEDFSQMQPGDILVAVITTPAWTPLFAVASAIVTDIGGPLSHGSIVAREYGIPAVLGTGVATTRIASGQLIEVDGDLGTIRILEHE